MKKYQKWNEAEKTLKQFKEAMELIKDYSPKKLILEMRDIPYDIQRLY